MLCNRGASGLLPGALIVSAASLVALGVDVRPALGCLVLWVWYSAVGLAATPPGTAGVLVTGSVVIAVAIAARALALRQATG